MSKIFPPYDPRPYEVVERKGTMVSARRDSKLVTCNSSFFKPIVKEEEVVMECPEICTPERKEGSRENHSTHSENDQPEPARTTAKETPTKQVTSRYPRRVRKPPDRYTN